jgi:hypothetical protein
MGPPLRRGEWLVFSSETFISRLQTSLSNKTLITVDTTWEPQILEEFSHNELKRNSVYWISLCMPRGLSFYLLRSSLKDILWFLYFHDKLRIKFVGGRKQLKLTRPGGTYRRFTKHKCRIQSDGWYCLLRVPSDLIKFSNLNFFF